MITALTIQASFSPISPIDIPRSVQSIICLPMASALLCVPGLMHFVVMSSLLLWLMDPMLRQI